MFALVVQKLELFFFRLNVSAANEELVLDDERAGCRRAPQGRTVTSCANAGSRPHIHDVD